MTAELYGGPITVKATAQNLQDALAEAGGFPTRQVFGVVTIRADSANAGTVWFGKDKDVTASAKQIGFIKADEALTIAITGAIPLGSIWFVGTVNDKVYVIGVAY